MNKDEEEKLKEELEDVPAFVEMQKQIKRVFEALSEEEQKNFVEFVEKELYPAAVEIYEELTGKK